MKPFQGVAVYFTDDHLPPLLKNAWEKLGGQVTGDWEDATFLVGDDVQSQKAQDVLANGFLLFSSNFLVQCMAQERVVNAGPFILHQTVARDEARPDEDGKPAALPSPARLSKKTGRGRRGAAVEEEEDVGQLVAMLEEMSSPEASPRYPKRATRTSVASSPPPSPPPPTSAKKQRKKTATPPKSATAKTSKKLLPVRKLPAEARKSVGEGRRRGGGGRRLGVDTVGPERLEELVAEFEDFFPNRDGAMVTGKTTGK